MPITKNIIREIWSGIKASSSSGRPTPRTFLLMWALCRILRVVHKWFFVILMTDYFMCLYQHCNSTFVHYHDVYNSIRPPRCYDLWRSGGNYDFIKNCAKSGRKWPIFKEITAILVKPNILVSTHNFCNLQAIQALCAKIIFLLLMQMTLNAFKYAF